MHAIRGAGASSIEEISEMSSSSESSNDSNRSSETDNKIRKAEMTLKNRGSCRGPLKKAFKRQSN